MPMISYAATSPYLSSKGDYPSVWRTVASDTLRVKAWADIAVANRWAHAAILVEPTLYSRGAAQLFELAAASKGISVQTFHIESAADVPRVMAALRKSKLKIVFAPCTEYLTNLLNEARRTHMMGPSSFIARPEPVTYSFAPNSKTPLNENADLDSKLAAPVQSSPFYSASYLGPYINFTLDRNIRSGDKRVQGYVWIFGDSIGTVMDTQFSDINTGILTVQDPVNPALEAFDRAEYRSMLESAKATVQIAYDAVNLSSSFRVRTSKTDSSGQIIDTRPTLNETMDVMYYATLSVPLARALMAVCEVANTHMARHGRLPNAQQMTSGLKKFEKVIFDESVFFDSQQDFASGELLLINSIPTAFMNEVGRWSQNGGIEMKSGPQWPTNKIPGISAKYPGKFIWADGTTRVPDDGIALESYIFATSPLGIIFLIWCSLLIIAVIGTTGVLIKYWNTPIFRLASPVPLSLILLGIVSLIVFVAMCVGRPSPAICTSRVLFYYVGLSLIFSPLITKTFRVWMVFRSANNFKAYSMSNFKLNVITLLFLLPALFIAILRISFMPAKDARHILAKDNSRVDVVCSQSSIVWGLVQISWAGIQMCMTLFLAWKTRAVPDGFNETKHVFISAYFINTVGVLGLLTSTLLDATNVVLSYAFYGFSVLVVCSGTLVGLFLPKLIIALLKPEKNTVDLLRKRDLSLPYIEEDTTTRDSVGFNIASYEPPAISETSLTDERRP